MIIHSNEIQLGYHNGSPINKAYFGKGGKWYNVLDTVESYEEGVECRIYITSWKNNLKYVKKARLNTSIHGGGNCCYFDFTNDSGTLKLTISTYSDNAIYVNNNKYTPTNLPSFAKRDGNWIEFDLEQGFADKMFLNNWQTSTVLDAVELYIENYDNVVYQRYDVGAHTLVDYLHISPDNKTAGILLNYRPTANDVYEIDMQTIGYRDTPMIIGQKTYDDVGETHPYQLGICIYTTLMRYYYDYGGGRISTYMSNNLQPVDAFNNRIRWQMGRLADDKLGIKNIESGNEYVSNIEASSQNFDSKRLLFGGVQWDENGSSPIYGSIIKYLNLKVWSLKIYDNGILARDYVPVRKSDGIYTLYDKIRKEYAEPYGTITGPE